MNKLFYPKLAAQNLHKNRQFYLPYILTVLGTAAAFYILAALTNTKPTSTQTRYYYLSVWSWWACFRLFSCSIQTAS